MIPDGDILGYIGQSLYEPDRKLIANVSDIQIWNEAMDAETVELLAPSVEDKTEMLLADIQDVMMNGNASAEEVKSDLSFPANVDGVDLTWTVPENAPIAADGKVTLPMEDTDVTVKVSYTCYGAENTVEFPLTVKGENIDEILEVADGVMVARGDLGIEVPQERIPGIQRLLIRKCILAKKPVIVATQMLHTMINNPRPTRAEVTDIANAIYYRTDALMLSGETAYGKYPLEAVKTMTKVAAQAEKDKLPDNDVRIPLDENSNDVTAFLAKQAVKATTKLKIRAIITDSYSGRTARNLAAFRGRYPVLAICYKEKTMRHLALSYGVEAIYMPELANGQEYYFAALRRLLKEGRLQPTDMVGYLSSGKAGTQTSFLEINVVEDVLKHAEDCVLPNSNRYL